MCPKMNNEKKKMIIMSNSSMTDRLKYKMIGFHRITIAAIILYIIFVIIFIIVNVFMCIWNVKVNRKKYFLTSKYLYLNFFISIKFNLLRYTK